MVWTVTEEGSGLHKWVHVSQEDKDSQQDWFPEAGAEDWFRDAKNLERKPAATVDLSVLVV
jgi:hypothetical protein